jgi:hypothetical protein
MKNSKPYNKHMHTTNMLTKNSREYYLILMYIRNPDIHVVEESDMFDEYVQEIYDFLYKDEVPEEIRDARLSICRKRAKDNIVKKANRGKIQNVIHVPIKRYLELEDRFGGRKVAEAIAKEMEKL